MMLKFIILFATATYFTGECKSVSNHKLNVFEYDPADVYSLPQDIDDEKPAVIFSGNLMKAKIEKLENIIGTKKFKLGLRTQNGIEVNSVGKLKDDKTFVVSGSYSFTGSDGKRYRTRYTADELGYHPITELQLDIPEPQSSASQPNRLDQAPELTSNGAFKKKNARNRFQFLNRNLQSVENVMMGSNVIGDDYTRTLETTHHGYQYQRPGKTLQPAQAPGWLYLPAE